MNLKLKYGHPVPRKWRKIGDYVLLTVPAIDGILLSIPSSWMDAELKQFVFAVWSFIAVGVKFWTNTRVEQTGVREKEFEINPN